MYETIYNIYIGDYHFETCVDEEGVSLIYEKAKRDFPSKQIRILKENVPTEVINKMIYDKIAHNRKVWEEAKKTDNVIGYVNAYWDRKEYENTLLVIHNT